MELTASLPASRAVSRRLEGRFDTSALSAWTFTFALVTYLALRDGGYDTIVRSQVGVAVWWIVLLAALAGILPARIGAAGWVAIGLLAGFTAWTGLAIGWSQSAGNSVIELGREATYVGFFVLAVTLQGRTAARHTINGVASAIGLVTALAVLSRLHPQAFPSNGQLQFLGATAVRRLSYPVNYWNGLAAFAAIGVPLLLAIASTGRTIAVRALAAATLPLSALCLYLTVSRGGVLELAIGLAVFFMLFPRRLEAVGTLLITAAGGAILILAASRHPQLRSGLVTPAAIDQGANVLAVVVIVCGGVALLQAALALADRYFTRPAMLSSSRRQTARRALAACATALVAAIALGVPSTLSHQWHNFTEPPGAVVPASESTLFSRLSAINGNGRYQYWQAAVDANATDPLVGIGPGTFEYWWASHATTSGFVRNAHSLYLETLAETGIIGLLLLGGFLLSLIGTAVRRSLREPADLRISIAAAGAGLAAFLGAAAIEWVWQLAAVAATALILGAVIVAGRDERAPNAPDDRTGRSRAVIIVLAVLALVAVSVPLAGAVELSRSQAAAAAGNLTAAYKDSLAAQRLQPYAATPRLQEALVLEAAGDFQPAATAAEAATRDEPTNWQTWLTLARIDARRGAYTDALAALSRSEKLNPRSNLFRTR